MIEQIQAILRASAELKSRCAQELAPSIATGAEVLVEAFTRGGKLVACGNGGSASDAQHFVAELVGRFQMERPALCAIALTENSSNLTSISNDFGYENVFARQIEGLVRAGDVVLAISTSGNSPNILTALGTARRVGARTLGLTGQRGGKMLELCDACVVVPHDVTARIQEVHITVLHMWAELLERRLFGARN